MGVRGDTAAAMHHRLSARQKRFRKANSVAELEPPMFGYRAGTAPPPPFDLSNKTN